MKRIFRIFAFYLVFIGPSTAAILEAAAGCNVVGFLGGGMLAGTCDPVNRATPNLVPDERLLTSTVGEFDKVQVGRDPTRGNIQYSASAGARANYGNLGAGAAVVLSGTGTNISASGQANASSNYSESFTVASNTLVAGSPLLFEFTNILNRNLDELEIGQNVSARTKFLATTEVFLGGSLVGSYSYCAGICGNQLGAILIGNSGIDTFVNTIPVHVGDILQVTSRLVVQADAFWLPGRTNESVTGEVLAEVTSFESAHSYFQLQGAPDAVLIAESGHNYALPSVNVVPEPNTTSLLAIAVFALLAWRRRLG